MLGDLLDRQVCGKDSSMECLQWIRGSLQVLYGTPKGKEEQAQALRESISYGLRGVLGAIDAK